MTLSLFSRMARNNAYANDALLSATATLSDAEFNAPRTGFFPSLRLTLGHIYLVDLFYLDALTLGGRGRAIFSEEAEPATATELKSLQAAADARLIAFCDAGILPTAMTTVDWTGGPATEPTESILLHLFQHQIHHRGQAHGMLSGTDVAPPQLDEFFPVFDRAPSAQRFWEV
ncbi:DinB family protein [Gymnodinialimonas sp.]